MKFSIVIPVYNKQDFLGSCFASLEAQTCHDFEVVLVDDGSTDKSSVMCDEFAKKSGLPVTVIHKQNEGLMCARRDGIHAAKGEYIIHHDADDDLRNICVESLAKRLSETGADVIWFCFSMQPDYSDRVGAVDAADEFPTIGIREARMLICKGGYNAIDTKVARRELLQALEVYDLYPEVMIGEDLLQSANLYSESVTTEYVSDSLCFYNQNEQSSTRNYSRKSIEDVAKASEYLLARSSEWGAEFRLVAEAGVARQFCGVAAMVEESPISGAEKAREMDYLSCWVRRLISHDVKSLGLNGYHALLIRWLMRGYIRPAGFLVRLRKAMAGERS